MARPQLLISPGHRLEFHVREVVSTTTGRYDESLWLFGNTATQLSVAFQVTGFRPYFLLDYPTDLGDLETWKNMMNEDLSPWDGAPDDYQSRYCRPSTDDWFL